MDMVTFEDDSKTMGEVDDIFLHKDETHIAVCAVNGHVAEDPILPVYIPSTLPSLTIQLFAPAIICQNPHPQDGDSV